MQSGKVSGALLYAQTDEAIMPDHEYRMAGNKINVKTLDLSGDFETIKQQLNYLVKELAEQASFFVEKSAHNDRAVYKGYRGLFVSGFKFIVEAPNRVEVEFEIKYEELDDI